MRILFISNELIGSAVIHRLIDEGDEVKLYIGHEDRKSCFDGIVEKVDDWKAELEWVGKSGLIIFDDVVFDGVQDKLRNDGYSVFGGDSQSDKLELDRHFFHKILEKSGIKILPSYDFKTADNAKDFVKNNIDTWVVKQNTHLGMLNYVGQKSDAKDVLDILEAYKQKNISPVHLQKKVVGIEVGVGRYFNGNDWVGPIEINFEHKALCNDDLGPLTAEMGTLMWYEDNEELPLFKETLHKVKDHLKEINYKGDIDINCIVNEEGIWPLEATPRFGTPSTELQCELHKSPWGDFLKAIADGEKYNLDYHREFGIVISVAVPPFPYAPEFFGKTNIETNQGVNIFFTENLTDKEMKQIHFEEVSLTVSHGTDVQHYLAGKHGYSLYVTGRGETVEDAQKEAYDVVKKIIIPRMFYRTDIGNKFISEERQQLKDWGWL